MRTAKILLPALLLLSASVFSQFRYNDPSNENYEYKNYENKECQCECEYCKEGHHNQWGENEFWKGTISTRDFNDLKEVIAGKSFESTKITIAKRAMDDNYFTTEQVRSILTMFTFESNKLDLAKYAYSKTVDNNKYYKLYDVFTFESNISDLEEFIRKQ